MPEHLEYLLVAGALVVQEARVLFVRQTYPPYVGLWGFPTGVVDPGELVDVAALRETQEEAGITAQSQGVLSLYSVGGPRPMLYVVVLAAHVSGTPTPDGSENDRAAYLTWDEIDALHNQGLIIPPCYEMARHYFAGPPRLLTAAGDVTQHRGRGDLPARLFMGSGPL